MDFGSSTRFPQEIIAMNQQQQQYGQPEEEEMEKSSPGDHHHHQYGSSLFIEKEHMFDKVVTPSDVGKLNRLVIPKQHAEKYFPLDSSSNEKGLLLNFEDRTGKSWRFRYSYWTSSQSYVMTKGWSRFVKEKRLDAGDIVSFQREVGKDRFFIDWRRRPIVAHTATPDFHHHHHHLHGGPVPQHHFQVHQWRSSSSNNPLATPLSSIPRDHVFHLSSSSNHHHNNNNNVSLFHNYSTYNNNPIIYGAGLGSPVVYHLRSAAAGGGAPPQEAVLESVPVAGHGNGRAAAKTLRLFGVNMECAVSEEHSDEYDVTTSSSEFRLYNGMPMSMSLPMPTPNNNDIIPTTDFFGKGKSSMSSSFDFGT